MDEVKAVETPTEVAPAEKSVDQVIDEAFGQEGQAEPASEESKPEEAEGETAPTETEEKPEGDPKVKDPVRERLARQRDAERQKTAELLERSKELEAKLSQFQKVTQSPEFVKAQMKAEGYTDDAINKRLRDMGVDVPNVKPDVFSLIKSKLGINPDDFDPQYKQGLAETERVIDLILDDRLSRILPSQMAPLEKTVTEMQRKSSSAELLRSMKDTISKEGILDFDKDLVPEMEKFITANPQATQEDLGYEFQRLNHTMALDRLKTKGKKDERDVKKDVLRGKVVEGAGAKPATGFKYNPSNPNSLDALLDEFNVR